MKITTIEIRDFPPIKHFAVSGLSDVVVVGGPNGVGKTKLQEAILQKFRSPHKHANVRLVVQATSPAEIEKWGGRTTLDTGVPADVEFMRQTLRKSVKRAGLRSGVLNFDSSRVFEPVSPYNFSWDFPDPFEEQVGWDVSLTPLRGRFTDTVHSMHRKLRSQKEEIANKALLLQAHGSKSMPLEFGDPLVRFKEVFMQLLPGKSLVDLDERSQELRYLAANHSGPLSIMTLSSGEREVVGIVFDFLLRDPTDCVVLFDEPEVHLHPELSYRLLSTLRDAGERNQFMYCTHSAEIISASLESTVVFIRPADGDKNQAVVMTQESEASEVLRLLGQSLGIISLGRRIVLIEGDRNSLDKQTYSAILGTSHQDLVLVAAGGRDNIEAFAKAVDTVLNRAVWGVDFFALCDGDAAVGQRRAKELEAATEGRLRRLPRYHLENYFLDANVLAAVFGELEDDASVWHRDPHKIEAKLRELAAPLVSYAASLRVSHDVRLTAGNVDIMPQDCHGKSKDDLGSLFERASATEGARMLGAIEHVKVQAMVTQEYEAISAALDAPGDTWKRLIPGRPILHAFAKATKLDIGRLKRLYLRAAKTAQPDPFADIKEIFSQFASVAKR